jgi:hypothetical protein
LEIAGSTAAVHIGQLENAVGGGAAVQEAISWKADAGGITPLVVTGSGPLASTRVRLQNPTELASNTGAGFDVVGDGIALELNLAAITSSSTLMLVDNRTPDPMTGFFEDGATTRLYAEGEQIAGTGFNGVVTISYVGGNGNDAVLTLVAAGLSGDHNADGIVDAADYVAWRKSITGGMQGYHDWKNSFGSSLSDSGDGATVPEPGASLMTAIAMFALRVLGGGRGDK